MKVSHSTRFKKLLACILSVVMVCTIMFSIAPANVMADSTYGDFYYEVLSDNTIEITEYTGSGGSVSIPSTIAGKRVTVIGNAAFDWCDSLTSITIPNGVTSIGERAFFCCFSLENITIPNSVTSIGWRAFANCESLINISIPNGVTSIGEQAFLECTSLESVSIPNSVTCIGDGAFTYCSSLINITIPNGVTSIGGHTFQSCESLPRITIPNSVTSIGFNAFYDCESLESITIPDSVTSIEGGAFGSCESLENVTIPNSVIAIGEDAFTNEVEHIFGDDYIILDTIINIDKITIYCANESVAHQYALDNGINYEFIQFSTPTPTPRPTATSTPRPTSTPSQGNSTIPPATGNTVNRQEAQNFATRCYELVLDRTPDATGLNNWTNSLVNNQNTGAHMAYGFFFSQEYINSNTSNEEYVTTLYNVFLDRAPDQGGLNDWVGQLETGASREQVFAGVANSREFFGLCNGYGITAGHYVQGLDNSQQQSVNAFVARLYSMCLGRNGDYAGQESWVRQLINHENSGAGVGYGFFFSQEFINRNLTNEEYVATLYRVFLGREPDQAGFNSWVSQLNNGADRLSIFRGFAHSQEYTNICSSYGIERGSV